MKLTTLCRGRVFRDAIQDGHDFRLRFMDGLEVICAWGSAGPEIKAYSYGVITQEMEIHPQFRYVCGKVVNQMLTEGTLLIIEFTDGHSLRSSFGRRGPEVEGVDVKVAMPSPIAAITGIGAVG